MSRAAITDLPLAALAAAGTQPVSDVESVIQNRLASAGLLGLRERPVQVTRSATIACSLNNANFCISH
jgi:hypothetical protein